MSGPHSKLASPRVAIPDLPSLQQQQHRRPRVTVLGERNSGKTTLVNTIAGAPLLTVSPIIHTAHPTLVSYARRRSLAAELSDRKRVRLNDLDHEPDGGVRRLHVRMPLPALNAFSLIDTPAIDLEDIDERTLAICRTADIVIWCTPAVQAWKAREADALELLPRRVRARAILAVTFSDLVSGADMQRLMMRLQVDAGALFRSIVPASSCAETIGLIRSSPRAKEQARLAHAADWIVAP